MLRTYGVTMDAETITITVDRPTAQALRHLLHMVGEHWAAGADLLPPPFGEMEQLGVVLRTVDRALRGEQPTGWRDAAETRLVPDAHADRADPTDPEADLARALTDLGMWLTETGQRHRGLIAFEAAVENYRWLAGVAPAIYRPHVARALIILGNGMAKAGYREEALNATEQAVEIYRWLAADKPAVHEPDLTHALTDLGSRLSDVGRGEEAVAAAEEAEEIRVRLVGSQRPHRTASNAASSVIPSGE